MHSPWRRALLIVMVFAAALPTVGNAEPEPRLAFDVSEGPNLNSFLREGPVAAHLLLRSGLDPRILIAFPAGNSGVGLWFAHAAGRCTGHCTGRPQPLTTQDARGRPLYGMTAEAIVTGARLGHQASGSLQRARTKGLSSVGHLSRRGRCQADDSRLDHHVGARSARRRGRISAQHRGHSTVRCMTDHLTAASDGKIAVKITALSGETPLTPLVGRALAQRSGAGRCRGPQCAHLLELPREVSRRLLALQYLFRARHPDVGAPADARAGSPMRWTPG